MDKRLSSRISNLLLVIFLVFIVLLAIIKLMFPAEHFRQQITQQLTKSAGQPIEVVGPLEWYLSPFPSLYANQIVAKDSHLAFEDVSISFNLLALARLNIIPSSVEIERLLSIKNLNPTPLAQQVSLHFNASRTLPHSFNFMFRPSSLNNAEFKVQGELQSISTERVHVEAVVKNQQSPSEPALFDHITISLGLAKGELENTHEFEVSVSTGQLTGTSKGVITTTDEQVTMDIAQLSTSNMSLSGQSIWQRSSGVINNTLNGQQLSIPDHCFNKPSSTNLSQCYDLALLMMLPGENSLKVDSVNTFNQTLKDVSINWQRTNDDLHVKDASAQAMGGALSINGNYSFTTKRWKAALQTQKVQIESFLETLTLPPQLFGNANINLTGQGELSNWPLGPHAIKGEVIISNGHTSLFNLEKELCTQVKGVVITDSNTTPFKQLTITIDKDNNQLKVPYFISELDGATINGQGDVTHDRHVSLNMNVKLDKQEWSLCKLPRALTGVDWPLKCNKPLNGRGDCSINYKQMGLSALLLVEDPERKNKAKQQLRDLKDNKKVKDVLNRLDKWLED